MDPHEPDSPGPTPDRELHAAIAGYDPDDPAAGRRIVELLGGNIRRIAEAVSRARRDWVRDDFVADAVAFVLGPRAGGPRIKRFDPARGSVHAWLTRVLQNAWRSVLRSRRNEARPLRADLPDRAAPIDWGRVAEHLGAPFGLDDRARIDGWPVRDRVELLGMAGLTMKVPAADWERYLVEYEAAVGRRLARPFPPADVMEADDSRARTRPLADALGIRLPNTLTVRWNRTRWRVEELTFIRDLRPDGAR